MRHSESLTRLVIVFAVLFLAVACGNDDRTRHAKDLPDGGSADAADTGLPEAGLSSPDGTTSRPDAASDAPADASTAVDAGEPLVLSAYCDAVADWYYDYLARCYGTDPYPSDGRAAFVEDTRTRCLYAQLAVDGDRLDYDGFAAMRCAESLDTIACYADFNLLPDCQGIFTGTVLVGGSCYQEETLHFSVGTTECDQGLCVGATCPQHCVAYPARGAACVDFLCGPDDYCNGDACEARKGRGEPCDGNCESGLTCADTRSGRFCTVPVPVGGGCADDAPCAVPGICVDGECRQMVAAGDPCLLDLNCPTGTACVPSADDPALACRPAGVVGAPCSAPTDCATENYCDRASFPDPGVCRARIALGQTCTGAGSCVSGAWCRYPDDTSPPSCSAIGSAGDGCLSYGSPDSRGCATGLFCVSTGQCAVPGAQGDPCAAFENGSCQAGLYCDRETGTCIPPSAQGSQCNPFWENTCAAGLGCHCGQANTGACGTSAPTSTPTDTCEPLRPLGQACFRSVECASSNCSDAGSGTLTCLDPVTEPAPCLGGP